MAKLTRLTQYYDDIVPDDEGELVSYEAYEELQAKYDALREAMTGWYGYCKRNGVYVDDVQEFFDEVLKEQADE